ncbi:putative odorant receptor 71a, partial [Pseudolycoriella hygida]
LIEHMNNYFSMDFFSQICLSGTVLSSVVYQVTTMSPLNDFVIFSYNMTFMITISTQAFLNSYFGQSILTASEELSNAAYFSRWYAMSIGYRKDLLILMERLKISSELKAGKLFGMNLDLFGTIMNFAYRLYSILKGGSF